MSAPIKDVKAKHESSLLKLQDVSSIGIGLDKNGKPAIIVGLEKSNSVTEAQLPDQLEGHPVSVRIVGRIKSL